MRVFFKKIGKSFFVLSQKNEQDIRQSVLLVDGRNILPNNFVLIIKGVKNKFKNARLVIITFPDKKELLKESFPDAQIIVPRDKLKTAKYQLAIEMFLSLRRKYNFIILSSLDISLLFVSLFFGRCQVFLHNKWLEWYKIRGRTLFDILRGARSADINRVKKKKDIKQILKSFGRCFLILDNVNEKELECRILIEDNGYTEIGHIDNVIQRAENIFINCGITILTYPRRQAHFINRFPEIKPVIVEAENNKYALAVEMLRLSKNKYDYVILTTLDILPILSSFLFLRAKVLLYNRWHQWWSLDIRSITGYLRPVFRFLAMVPVFIYLLITTGGILLRTAFRLRSASCQKESFF